MQTYQIGARGPLLQPLASKYLDLSSSKSDLSSMTDDFDKRKLHIPELDAEVDMKAANVSEETDANWSESGQK